MGNSNSRVRERKDEESVRNDTTKQLTGLAHYLLRNQSEALYASGSRDIERQPSDVDSKLKAMGDKVNEEHGDDIRKIVISLGVTPENAFQIFCDVAKSVLQEINWGRVVIVLLFVVAIIVTVAVHFTGIGTIVSFVSMLIGEVAAFLGSLLWKWIATKGGLAVAIAGIFVSQKEKVV